jgi:type II secretory pathway predicted ATPase ExeA
LNEPVAFGPTPNPEAYVPWSGSERALAELRRWALDSDSSMCLLVGPPGMGKTLLLKLLAARARDALRPLFLAYPDRSEDELCRWMLAALGGAAADDARGALREAIAREDRGVLLLVDEGELLPADTSRWLRELAAGVRGRLRIAIALTREPAHEALAELFGPLCETVRIEEPMSRADVAAHVRAELARAAVDDAVRARFDDEALGQLHERSQGVPRSLQSLGAALLFEAQRARGAIEHPHVGEIRAALAAADPDSAVASRRRAGPSSSSRPEMDLPTPPAAPDPDSAVASRRRAGPSSSSRWIFAFGIALGLAAGLAATQAQRLLRAVLPAPPARERPLSAASEPALPPVAAPAPAARPAAEPAVVAAPPPQPVPPVVLSLNADPWARIEIDGAPVGETPIAALPVAPGRHRVTARMPDGRVLEREVDVHDGNRRIVFP